MSLEVGSLLTASVVQPLGRRRVNVGWVSRPRTKYNSRAVVNEAAMLADLRTHYGDKIDLRELHFNRSLTQAMQDVSSLDVLAGMHGAGALPT